jgi:hypothetical protein
MKKIDFKRYVVVGSRRLVEHAYSTELGNVKALDYAIDCADHESMRGKVYGETEDRSRTEVYCATFAQ